MLSSVFNLRQVGVAFLCGLLAAPSVYAGLGDREEQVAQDVHTLNGRHSKRQSSTYTVHEISNDAFTVREYLDSEGVVFGVAWNGVTEPDLRDIFGPYYSEYEAELKAHDRHSGRSGLRLSTANVHVLKSGHQRDVRGKAVIPSRMPANVTLDEIQ